MGEIKIGLNKAIIDATLRILKIERTVKKTEMLIRGPLFHSLTHLLLLHCCPEEDFVIKELSFLITKKEQALHPPGLLFSIIKS